MAGATGSYRTASGCPGCCLFYSVLACFLFMRGTQGDTSGLGIAKPFGVPDQNVEYFGARCVLGSTLILTHYPKSQAPGVCPLFLVLSLSISISPSLSSPSLASQAGRQAYCKGIDRDKCVVACSYLWKFGLSSLGSFIQKLNIKQTVEVSVRQHNSQARFCWPQDAKVLPPRKQDVALLQKQGHLC